MWFDKIIYPFTVAIAWVWVKIHDLLVALGMSGGPGVAWIVSIIVLTIVVRALITPLYVKQLRSQRAMSVMQPEMKKIQEKYKGKTDQASRLKMSEEMQALNKKYGTNPFASCLPLLVQMPILFGMYRALWNAGAVAQGTFNLGDHIGPIDQALAQEIERTTVAGVSLSGRLTESTGVGLAVFIILAIFMVVLQFLTMKISMERNMPQQAQDSSNPMMRTQKMMMYLMPLMFVFTAFVVQMGIMIYLSISTAWTFGQQMVMMTVMPTPGSPAYKDVLAKRERGYKEWAKPYFEEYDRKREELGSDPEAVAQLNQTSLKEIKSKARSQRVAGNFPESMSEGEVVGVYRNLALQEWTTLPDETWMRGVHRAKERSVVRQEKAAKREQPRRMSREQRKQAEAKERRLAAEHERAEQNRRARREANDRAKSELTPEEVERRRAQRKSQRNNPGQRKKKKRK